MREQLQSSRGVRAVDRERAAVGVDSSRRGPRAMLAATMLLAALGLWSCGGGGERAARSNQVRKARQAATGPLRLTVKLDSHTLPAPVSGEAALALPTGIFVLGGLDIADISTDEVTKLDPGTAVASKAGVLSEPKHDLAAAELSGRTLIFGGGSTSELDAIESVSPPARGQVIAHLPSTRSDLSAVSVGSDVYLLGGYDGQAPLAAVLRTSDGTHFTTAAALPVPVRYAATAVLGTKIYAFGGELASGEDTDAIQAIDTASGRASVVGHLPRAFSHASAVVLGGRAYVLGGRAHETPLRHVLVFDPASGAMHAAGRLPFPVTNAAATQSGTTGYLIGGLGEGGQTLDSIIELRLRAG
jgi:hypothetical protein